MERSIQQELKRRTVKVRVFPGEDALLRLVSAVLVEIDEKMGLRHKGLHQVGMPGCMIRSQQNFQTKGCSIAQQPAALTEAALEPCSGGAFHPGVELSYYLRLPPLYARAGDPRQEPFRIALGDRDSLIQNVGRLLTTETAMQGGNGAPPPIGPQMPGDLTRWMGLPWQCDAFSCQQVLMQEDFPTAVWWPALLPVDVLPEVYYLQLLREDLPASERQRFYNSRVAWSRGGWRGSVIMPMRATGTGSPT